MWLEIIFGALLVIAVWFLFLKLIYWIQLKFIRRKYDPEENLSRRGTEDIFNTRTARTTFDSKQHNEGNGKLNEGQLLQNDVINNIEPDSREPAANSESNTGNTVRRSLRRKKVEDTNGTEHTEEKQ